MSRHQPTWLVTEEYRTTLSPSVLNRLINREGVKRALLRRYLASRTVTCLELASPGLPPLYLKEYRLRTFTGRIKHLFRSPADREWHTALRIAERGVPTFVPLAVGNERRFGLPTASYLITKEIGHAQSLKDYLVDHHLEDALQAGADRKQITSSLARFVKDLHRKGVVHHDFHWGNILIDAGTKEAIRWYLMDLHRAKLKTRLHDRQRVNNLAALNTAFRYTTRKTERLRFLALYAQGDKRWEKRLHYFARLIENSSDRMIRKNWHKQERRCLKHNRYFVPFSSSAYRGFMRRDVSSPGLLQLLQDPGRAFLSAGCVSVKDSRTTSSCTLPVETAGGAAELFIKRYNYQNSLYAFKNLFRRSRAKRAWKTAQGLQSRNIPTPLPIAYVERRRARVLRESFFIARKVDDSIPLSMLCRDAGAGAKGEHAAGKKTLIHRAAVLVRMMHERGIWHRDLKAANILVQKAPGDNPQLYLTDLDSIRFKQTVEPRERMRDLARLNVSLLTIPSISVRDRLRFLYSYLNTSRTRDKKLRAYWVAIGRETGKKLAKDSKKL